jgi:hypothetical protein
MQSRLLAAAVLLTVASTGCDFFKGSETAPSVVTPQMLSGSWNSVAIETQRPDTCTKFVWNVTQVSGNTASGSFTATCRMKVLITGTATGTLEEKTLTWSATATATVPGFPSCKIALSGTGTFDGLQMRLPFDGTTCDGEVVGTEILRK